MKKVLLCGLASLMVMALIFLVFAFGFWDINPKHWDGASRGLSGFCYILMGGFTFAGLYTVIDDKP